MLDVKSQPRVYINNDKVAQIFLQDVRRNSVLTPEEQNELIKKAQAGDLEARNKLIVTNMGFVISLAKHLGSADNYNDLVNEGVFGFVRAIEKFDFSKKVKFLTYAVYWIRMYMKEYLATKNSVVVNKNNSFIFKYIPKIKNEFFVENGREPTLDEIFDLLQERKMKVPSLEGIRPVDIVSIDAADPHSRDEFSVSKIFSDYEKTTSSNNIDVDIEKMDKEAIINLLMGELSEEDQDIVRWKFGFDGIELTFLEIATKLGIKESTAKRRYDTSMKKLGKKAERLVEQKYIKHGTHQN